MSSIRSTSENNNLFSSKVEIVKTTTLDFFEFRSNEKVRLLKIDCEGAELQILRGAADFFSRNRERPFIIFEYSPLYLLETGDDPKDLLSMLDSWSYDLRVIKFDGSLGTEVNRVGKGDQVNVLATPRSSGA